MRVVTPYFGKYFFWWVGSLIFETSVFWLSYQLISSWSVVIHVIHVWVQPAIFYFLKKWTKEVASNLVLKIEPWVQNIFTLLEMLHVEFCESIMSKARVYEQYKRFWDGLKYVGRRRAPETSQLMATLKSEENNYGQSSNYYQRGIGIGLLVWYWSI